MTRKSSDDQTYGPSATQGRLKTILRGAFGGAPTPLKAIPKQDGGRRKVGRKPPKKRG
jgi:hypothetical protein